VEPELEKFRSKGARVGAIKEKWPTPESERSWKVLITLNPEQVPEPLEF